MQAKPLNIEMVGLTFSFLFFLQNLDLNTPLKGLSPRKVLCPAVLRSASDAFGNVPAQVEGEITLLTQKKAG